MDVKKYRDKLRSLQQIADSVFIGTYLATIVADGVLTFVNITSHAEESNQFVSFLMEKYGVGEGLLRIQGIEALQLAVLLGVAHTIIELWKWLKGEMIDMEVRLALVYVYAAVGIAKHLQGILSWF
jgi:hypothetical protein